MNRLAAALMRSRNAHPIGWQLLDIALGVVMTVALWAVIGRTAGIAFAIFWGVLTLFGLILLPWRIRAARR